VVTATFRRTCQNKSNNPWGKFRRGNEGENGCAKNKGGIVPTQLLSRKWIYGESRIFFGSFKILGFKKKSTAKMQIAKEEFLLK
jgi:hypothetical protein